MTNAVVERLRQKVTYFYEGDIDEREGEERDKGRRKREDKDERGRGERKEERGIYLFVLYPRTSFIGK